jgi:hypothetical protein
MADGFEYLVTGSGGATVRTMFNREDSRANEVRALAAQVIVDDLTRPHGVVSAMRGAKQMLFTMSVSASYLKAAATACAAAHESCRR